MKSLLLLSALLVGDRDPFPVPSLAKATLVAPAERNIFAAYSLKDAASDNTGFELRTFQVCDGNGCRLEQRWVAVQAASMQSLAPPSGGNDALEQLNAQRAQRGLRPYIHDAGLTQAAQRCAEIRAERLIFGHINDFAYVPSGSQASASGCAAWEPSWGFGACAVYDNYTYCGAAWVMGRDGKRYCHAFYR